jgi:putative DNA primase/helicase
VSAAIIAKVLGGSGRSRGGWYAATCPVCGSEDKLGVKDTETGLAVNCFRLCRRADILAELDRLGLLSDTAAEPEDPEIATRRQAKEEAWRRQRIAEARDFIGECQPWAATNQIAQYLRSRGIDPDLLPATILWRGLTKHPEGGTRPLMVGVIEHVQLGIIGVTRTFIATDGSQKAAFHKPRLFLGLAAGGAVRLGPVSPHVELVVGEGIESTLAYMQLRGLPGWAALSAGGIKNLVLPSEARRVVIAADNDLSGVGWRAALAAARRWVLFGGRQVRIDMPALPGSDWNDALMSSRGLGNAA